MKQLLFVVLVAFSCSALAEWVEYSTRSNGDVHYYDSARVERSGSQVKVWARIRYRTSVMAASSYQQLLKIDCTENTQTTLQNTFFTDREWAKPAMATNTNAKPKKIIEKNSAIFVLSSILCED